MPSKLVHPCNHPMCKVLTHDRFCDQHKQQQQKVIDTHRGSAHERGYGYRWQKARVGWLREHPVCVQCGREGTLVDHKIPHKGDMKLFWDTSNWQTMCDHCHNVKRQKESRENV